MVDNQIKSVKVWDIFVRLFHWALVGTIIVQYVSAESNKIIHKNTGYLIVCLVLLRIIWGLLGPKYARFSDFLYRPSMIIQYLSGLIRGKPKRYLGHNPAGGLMVFVMLITLTVTAFTGLKAIGSKGHGPFADKGYQIVRQALADMDDDEAHSGNERKNRSLNGKNEFWGEFHEAMTGFLLFLIIVHICGVIISSRIHRENLIWAMITGEKRNE
jgi:cytochrome b